MSQPKATVWKAGCEEKMPCNIGRYDVVRCQKIVKKSGPFSNQKCNQILTWSRVYEAGIQFKKGQAQCTGFGLHKIQSWQMYVGVCNNVQEHIDMERNVCCRVCVENYKVNQRSRRHTLNYKVDKDYFEYKQRSRKRRAQ